jgi:hypothetical protein
MIVNEIVTPNYELKNPIILVIPGKKETHCEETSGVNSNPCAATSPRTSMPPPSSELVKQCEKAFGDTP